jgi:two-component system cell cycle response regulator DivK
MATSASPSVRKSSHLKWLPTCIPLRPNVKTILLIEDNTNSARMEIRALRADNYRLLHAPDGESGLRMAMEEKPDLILLDLGLPDIEGQTLAALIRSAPGMAHVPLIAVTAWPPDTARQMAKAYGCDGTISKPISPRRFPSQIAAYFEEEIDDDATG